MWVGCLTTITRPTDDSYNSPGEVAAGRHRGHGQPASVRMVGGAMGRVTDQQVRNPENPILESGRLVRLMRSP